VPIPVPDTFVSSGPGPSTEMEGSKSQIQKVKNIIFSTSTSVGNWWTNITKSGIMQILDCISFLEKGLAVHE
jgi:hypothetical protein